LGCLVAFLIVLGEAALFLVSLIMAAFASDSPHATDGDIYSVFAFCFFGPNVLALIVYILYLISKKKARLKQEDTKGREKKE